MLDNINTQNYSKPMRISIKKKNKSKSIINQQQLTLIQQQPVKRLKVSSRSVSLLTLYNNHEQRSEAIKNQSLKVDGDRIDQLIEIGESN